VRAVVVKEFGSFETAEVRDIECPVPKKGEVLVRVEAVPVNYVDLVVAAGKYQFAPALPYTPGKGPSGAVVAIGEDVNHLAVGDRVLAMAETGGYAEYAVAPATDCYKLPEHLSFSQAGAMSLGYDTAWCALRDRARLKSGETVFILGASGAVGRACVQLARAMGAHVVAGISSPQRREAQLLAGAHETVDLSVANLRDGLREQVQKHTQGRGADIVIDMLGGDFFDAAIRAVAWRGRVVVVGFASERIPTLKVNYLMLKNIEVSGLQVSDYRKKRPDILSQCYQEIFSLFKANQIDVGEMQELPLSQFKEGMRLVGSRKAQGRVILVP
jgi:NADPH2:quinone reductase